MVDTAAVDSYSLRFGLAPLDPSVGTGWFINYIYSVSKYSGIFFMTLKAWQFLF